MGLSAEGGYVVTDAWTRRELGCVCEGRGE